METEEKFVDRCSKAQISGIFSETGRKRCRGEHRMHAETHKERTRERKGRERIEIGMGFARFTHGVPVVTGNEMGVDVQHMSTALDCRNIQTPVRVWDGSSAGRVETKAEDRANCVVRGV